MSTETESQIAMANRNYPTRPFPPLGARVCETHQAVAVAIHAISHSSRSPEAIWGAPTTAEWDHVTMAVEEYVSHGDFRAEEDGRYPWGQEAIVLDA